MTLSESLVLSQLFRGYSHFDARIVTLKQTYSNGMALFLRLCELLISSSDYVFWPVTYPWFS